MSFDSPLNISNLVWTQDKSILSILDKSELKPFPIVDTVCLFFQYS